MRISAVLLAALALAGCDAADPYRRADAWVPAGANTANIAVMASNPRDLIRGRSETRVDARRETTRVEQLWQGQIRALPQVTLGVAE